MSYQLSQSELSVHGRAGSPQRIQGEVRAAVSQEDAHHGFRHNAAANVTRLACLDFLVTLGGSDRDIALLRFRQYVGPQRAAAREGRRNFVDRTGENVLAAGIL